MLRQALRAAEAGVGAVAFDGLVGSFSPEANNRFEDNSYRVIDPGAAYWSWNGEILTWNQWHALGRDVNGTFELIAEHR